MLAYVALYDSEFWATNYNAERQTVQTNCSEGFCHNSQLRSSANKWNPGVNIAEKLIHGSDCFALLSLMTVNEKRVILKNNDSKNLYFEWIYLVQILYPSNTIWSSEVFRNLWNIIYNGTCVNTFVEILFILMTLLILSNKQQN